MAVDAAAVPPLLELLDEELLDDDELELLDELEPPLEELELLDDEEDELEELLETTGPTEHQALLVNVLEGNSEV